MFLIFIVERHEKKEEKTKYARKPRESKRVIFEELKMMLRVTRMKEVTCIQNLRDV
jgi:hypothetical protein